MDKKPFSPLGSKIVYCKDCKYYKSNNDSSYCKAPSNIIVRETYMYRYEEYKLEPMVKNKDNHCIDYKPKIIKTIIDKVLGR